MVYRLRWQKLAIAVLLTLGLTSTVLAVQRLRDPHQPPSERQELWAALLLLGITPLAGSAWLGRSLQRSAHAAQEQRLRAVFFESLRQSQGRVNVLYFAMQSQLSGDAAKTYLSDRAREFNATFDVDDSGGLTYCFDLGDCRAALLPEQSTVTYRVVITALPASKHRLVVRTLKQQTGLPWGDVKALVKEIPAIVEANLTLAQAQNYRQRLEADGATVDILVD
jgi:ribosomal protein L7/L12